MTGRSFAFLLAAGAAAAGAVPAAAQMGGGNSPLAVEVRGGIALPVAAFKEDLNLESGVGASASVALSLTPQIAVYGSYAWNQFGVAGATSLGNDVHLTDRGFSAGVRLGLPASSSAFSPWIKGGAVLGHKLRYASGSDHSDDTDGDLGFEVGGGLDFALGRQVSFTPGVTYTRFALKDALPGDDKVQHVGVDVGLRIRI
ncbi:MAG TPA: outer membrane beta-barrel protein [Longimicrobiaceae bacterium]|nr:outer membrane beta-barrel protein [Longimicrobiaceae bacterium]